jgi:S-ribosylhomocysteine lyase
MKMNVESFNLDHEKVKAPYIRLVQKYTGKNGDTLYKYDIRFKQPNREHMDMKGLHSLEHMMAEFIRNHLDNIIDVSPMGCQTGFYLTILNNSNFNDVVNALELTFKDILQAKEVPAANCKQCGWAENHNLEEAQHIVREMLSKKQEWDNVF